jgi:hypothetical protein
MHKSFFRLKSIRLKVFSSKLFLAFAVFHFVVAWDLLLTFALPIMTSYAVAICFINLLLFDF